MVARQQPDLLFYKDCYGENVLDRAMNVFGYKYKSLELFEILLYDYVTIDKTYINSLIAQAISLRNSDVVEYFVETFDIDENYVTEEGNFLRIFCYIFCFFVFIFLIFCCVFLYKLNFKIFFIFILFFFILIFLIGYNFLHLAVFSGNSKIITIILDNSDDLINAKDSTGSTPIFYVCEVDENLVYI